MNLQFRRKLVLLAFLLSGFVLAVGLATPGTAAAADAPSRYGRTLTSSAAKQAPAAGARLSVITAALPACMPTDRLGSCRGRDSLTSDNLTWDSVTYVSTGFEASHTYRQPQ